MDSKTELFQINRFKKFSEKRKRTTCLCCCDTIKNQYIQILEDQGYNQLYSIKDCLQDDGKCFVIEDGNNGTCLGRSIRSDNCSECPPHEKISKWRIRIYGKVHHD